ncbi:MAG: MurR/RpiR family transcriptional regulator [Oscillospiraceae bacterium]|nr:MurR/RpiR family transcriptional regulator [Oscillospiraceae bacterium]MCI6026418.1 MurR/RpiR family transcriptional regulator [Oscillospiraceae bacterium]MDY3219806.1 MurR/RpiR family transcriptional regulator [Candidatus Fimivivens sp.]SFJ28050.1 transcriptional regulator, RpiR family [Ruminococcaceae bacterium D5]
MFDAFLQKIKEIPLSKTDKVIADYLVDHRGTLGLQTATSLALEIGVSDTSIIRFMRKLGFSGYADFKRQMNDQMVKQYHEALTSGEKYRRTKGMLDQVNLVSAVSDQVIENLQKSCSHLDVDTIDRVAAILAESHRKFVAGFRGTSCCANYMSRKLVFFLSDVICCDQAESSAIERIADAEQGDCLLLYSFPRYTDLNISLIEMAKESGAKVILITDRITSPLAPNADLVLPVAVEGIGFTNSYVVPMCVSEMILLAVSKKMNAESGERIKRIENYMERNKMY